MVKLRVLLLFGNITRLLSARATASNAFTRTPLRQLQEMERNRNTMVCVLVCLRGVIIDCSGAVTMTELEAEALSRLRPLEYYRNFVDQDVRPDGRALDQFREMVIVPGAHFFLLIDCRLNFPLTKQNNLRTDTITSALASAMVRLGETSVVAAVKAEIAVPPEDEPNVGKIRELSIAHISGQSLNHPLKQTPFLRLFKIYLSMRA
jgi:hypothetical protein